MVSAAARRECRGAHTVVDYEKPADDPQARAAKLRACVEDWRSRRGGATAMLDGHH
mgnify:CR=1 FL=1